jgi:flagellin-like protein
MTRIRNVKNTTKFKRSIKAISPVIATLLMIAIAVVASLVVYAWVGGYIGFQTNNAGQAIQIQSYAPGAGTGDMDMDIYVQNVGQGIVEVDSVYINDDKVTINSPTDKTIDNGVTIPLNVALLTAWNPGTQVEIKVTTTSGTFSEIQGSGTGANGGSGNPSQYQIVVTQAANGAIAPNGGSYAAGSTPSFTITPNSGYRIASITANGATVTVTTPTSQAYQFPALAADSTLTATFALIVVNEVQHREVGINANAVASTGFLSVPAAGNLLVVTTGHRLTTDATPVNPIMPTGWNLAYVQRSDPWSSSHRRVIAIFWTISDGTADQSFTIDWAADADDGTGFAILQEFHAAVPVVWSLVGANGANGGNAIDYSILAVPGPVAAPTKTNILAISGMVWRDTPTAPITYTNSFVAGTLNTQSTAVSQTAYIYTNAGAHTWSTTVDWTTNRIASGLLALFTYT